MTEKLAPTVDSLAAYLITDLTLEARRDRDNFLAAVHATSTEQIAELTIVDEFDVPDDMYWLYDISDGADPRLDALFALRDEPRLYDLVHTAVIRLTEELSR